MMTANPKLAKMDELIASRTLDQLRDMFRLLRGVYSPEAALVRARIYANLCDRIGEDAADEFCE